MKKRHPTASRTAPETSPWGVPDWRNVDAYLPWDSLGEPTVLRLVGLFMWELMRRSPLRRNGWRAWKNGEFDDAMRQIAETSDIDAWHAAKTEPQPEDVTQCGWWWDGDAPRKFDPLSGVISMPLKGGLLHVDMSAWMLFGCESHDPVNTDMKHKFTYVGDPAAPREVQVEQFRNRLINEEQHLRNLGIKVVARASNLVRTQRKWCEYLRVLDARDETPPVKYAEMAKQFAIDFPNSKWKLGLWAEPRIKQLLREAKALRDAPMELKYIVPK